MLTEISSLNFLNIFVPNADICDINSTKEKNFNIMSIRGNFQPKRRKSLYYETGGYTMRQISSWLRKHVYLVSLKYQTHWPTKIMIIIIYSYFVDRFHPLSPPKCSRLQIIRADSFNFAKFVKALYYIYGGWGIYWPYFVDFRHKDRLLLR